VYLRLLADPSAFRREIQALPSGTWVVGDDVQRRLDALMPSGGFVAP